MVKETDLELRSRRTLHIYDAGADDAGARLAVFWHHGTSKTGAPPEPLFPAAGQRGIRWVSYDRPGYGGSPAYPGRDVASAAADVSSIADALGIDRFAVMGYSGGGPHALACARCCQNTSWVWFAWLAWPRSGPRGWTGSRAWRPSARRYCALPPGDAGTGGLPGGHRVRPGTVHSGSSCRTHG